jgi:hemerythrin superfamily protein
VDTVSACRKFKTEVRRSLLQQQPRLKHLYEEHIQVEEEIVFPRAVEVLDSPPFSTVSVWRKLHQRFGVLSGSGGRCGRIFGFA